MCEEICNKIVEEVLKQFSTEIGDEYASNKKKHRNSKPKDIMWRWFNANMDYLSSYFIMEVDNMKEKNYEKQCYHKELCMLEIWVKHQRDLNLDVSYDIFLEHILVDIETFRESTVIDEIDKIKISKLLDIMEDIGKAIVDKFNNDSELLKIVKNKEDFLLKQDIIDSNYKISTDFTVEILHEKYEENKEEN